MWITARDVEEKGVMCVGQDHPLEGLSIQPRENCVGAHATGSHSFEKDKIITNKINCRFYGVVPIYCAQVCCTIMPSQFLWYDKSIHEGRALDRREVETIRENRYALETVRKIKFKNEHQLDGQTISIPPEMTLSTKNGSCKDGRRLQK